MLVEIIICGIGFKGSLELENDHFIKPTLLFVMVMMAQRESPGQQTYKQAG
jgi:hypothetical protein